jgi:hypothetical protein
MNTLRSTVVGAALLTLPAGAQDHRFETDPVVTVRENFIACDVLSQLQRVMDDPRFLLTGECEPLSVGRRVRIYASRPPVCLYLSPRHDLAMQMDTRESVIEIIRLFAAMWFSSAAIDRCAGVGNNGADPAARWANGSLREFAERNVMEFRHDSGQTHSALMFEPRIGSPHNSILLTARIDPADRRRVQRWTYEPERFILTRSSKCRGLTP